MELCISCVVLLSMLNQITISKFGNISLKGVQVFFFLSTSLCSIVVCSGYAILDDPLCYLDDCRLFSMYLFKSSCCVPPSISFLSM